MTQVYFHCSSSRGVRIDQSGEAVSDLAEARDRAACIVRSLIMERGAEDWREPAVAREGRRRNARRPFLLGRSVVLKLRAAL